MRELTSRQKIEFIQYATFVLHSKELIDDSTVFPYQMFNTFLSSCYAVLSEDMITLDNLKSFFSIVIEKRFNDQAIVNSFKSNMENFFNEELIRLSLTMNSSTLSAADGLLKLKTQSPGPPPPPTGPVGGKKRIYRTIKGGKRKNRKSRSRKIRKSRR